MFRSRIHSRLLERYGGQLCREHCRRAANGSERCVMMALPTRGYATTPASGKASQNASRAINKPAPGSATSPRASGTSSTPASSTAEGSSSSPAAAALRTAEARESALRAARLRRLGQKQDREAEEAKRAEEKRAYKKRYDGAARKWVSTIIALPIMFVTSYYLFDRLALGNQPKSLEKYRGDKS